MVLLSLVTSGIFPSNHTQVETTMKKNVCGIDRIIRIVAGIALIAATVSNVLPLWGYIGVVPLMTGLINFCPLYNLIGISTCKAGE